jgi:DNA-binding NarL/FixJ family response regulator
VVRELEPDTRRIDVIIVAAYPSVRAGLRALLAEQPQVTVVAAWPDDSWETNTPPDALLIDVEPGRLDMPDRLSQRFPDSAQVLLLDRPDEYRHGDGEPPRPVAALLKDAGADEILAALRAVVQGLVVLDPAVAAQLATRPGSVPRAAGDFDERLTERETQVLQLLALGLPNKTIAIELGISEHTAKFHVGSIMAKLGAASRTEAVAQAARRGLLVL